MDDYQRIQPELEVQHSVGTPWCTVPWTFQTVAEIILSETELVPQKSLHLILSE
jgi:hypothetical protein